MPRPLCEDHENVLRAINEAHWDKTKNRASSGLFKGPNTSVSRLLILRKDEIFEKFSREFTCPVISAGELNVGNLKQIGQERDFPITVEQDPREDNPAHAEIPQRINNKRIAYAIIDSMIIHPLPAQAVGSP